MIVRLVIATILAVVLVVMWAGVAHSQQPSGTFGWKKGGSDAKPQSRSEYIDQILQERGTQAAAAAAAARAQGATSDESAAAPRKLDRRNDAVSQQERSQFAHDAISITDWIRQLAQGTGSQLASAHRPRTAPSDGSRAGIVPQPMPGRSTTSGNAVVHTTPSSAQLPTKPQKMPLAAPSLRGDTPRDQTPDDDSIEPLEKLRDEELTFRSSLDLALALERQFRHLGDAPITNLAVLRSSLTHHLIDLSMRTGHSDNPRDNLDAVRSFLAKVLRIEAVQRDRANLDLLLAGRVLGGHRASPAAYCLLALIFSERINSYLDLEPVVSGDLLALRYRSGNHRYLLIPLYPDRLYTDREFVALSRGGADIAEDQKPIRILTRKQLWGLIFAEAGSALLELENETAAASYWVGRALDLHPKQALGNIARARIHIQRNQLESAKESLDMAVEIEPFNIAARMQRAHLLEEMPPYQKALIDDLRWLSRKGSHPKASLRLARLFLSEQQFLAAQEEVQFLSKQKLPTMLTSDYATLRAEVASAPAIAVLTGEHPDSRRFQAIDQLRRYPLPSVYKALIRTLDDTNLRLSSYAWQALKEMTERTDLPKDPAAWQRALGL